MKTMITKVEQLPRIKEFLSTLISDKTRVAYLNDLLTFSQYLNMQQISIQAAKEEHVDLYRVVLASRYSPSTINRNLAVIRSYTRYLHRHGVIPTNVAINIKGFPTAEYTATPGLSNQHAVDIIGASKDKPLDHVVCLLLFYLGLRRAEIISLKVSSLVTHENIRALKVLGKGNKYRIIPVTDELLAAIHKLPSRVLESKACVLDPQKPIDPPLIPSPKDPMKPIHPNSITKIIKRNAKKANIPQNVSPHMARVTCISNALENGATHIQVLELGGWKSLEMVARYDRRRQVLKNSAVHKVSYNKT